MLIHYLAAVQLPLHGWLCAWYPFMHLGNYACSAIDKTLSQSFFCQVCFCSKFAKVSLQVLHHLHIIACFIALKNGYFVLYVSNP